MNILFLGSPDFAVPSLEILLNIDFIKIIAVVTHPDKPKGRHLAVSPTAVKSSALKHKLEVFQPERVSSPEFIEKLKDFDIDLIIIVSFGEILKKEVLNIPRLGCINIHAALLPKYRGAAPITWALINGEKKTGVTSFWLSEKMDSGDIIQQGEVEITPEDTRGVLEKRLSIAGAALLKDTLNRIKDNKAAGVPQDKGNVTFAPKIKKEDGLVDWSMSAVSIHNKIRAMNPWPVAFTFLGDVKVELWNSEVIEGETIAEPGTMSLLNKNGIGVAAGGGILLLKELQAEGKRKISAGEFIHGYRLNEGTMFRNERS